ncbi:RNA polymerase subunit sigma-70 [Sinomonas sp. ASV322]|uniref:RNA polymerase subunit sigma-70 n=1 Tax=Sinomonas sp. ASV322 TaxID=3041920 RepID=UPI0027DDF3C0|nr:RNA polymerase subunit sigma-70 [Sinomonas sp. ASV322]MDQ4504519.1 RNA polymerase subunit sigma-70 [Sinomonas sp. ASV322]
MTRVQDHASFELRIAPYRSELVAHCYRMLGSVCDAEDVVQETYLRAWRARERYDETRSSLRTWMYRIATNACLTALETRSRRPLPAGFVAETDPRAPFVRGEHAWLQPIPDARTVGIDRGTVRLAFVAALQHLSARQRAALILRDVLDFSAAETADIIGSTVTSVNSSLRRARATVTKIDPAQVSEPDRSEQRACLERYMSAFMAADVEGIKRLLAHDVLMEMPPMLNWFTGRENYATFMDWVFEVNGNDWRLEPVGANGQPAFAAYVAREDGYRLHTLQVFTMSPEGIRRLSVFQDDDVFRDFGLTPQLER